jgi:hypothetical protein
MTLSRLPGSVHAVEQVQRSAECLQRQIDHKPRRNSTLHG